MRARSIKPGFFQNEILAEIPPLGRLLFAGMWCLADRRGRLEDRPKRIQNEVLGFDRANCEILLKKLAEKGFIERYEVDGKRYIQIYNFEKHQNPHCAEKESTIPPHKNTVYNTIQSTVSSTEEAQCQAQKKHSSNPADSLYLTPDSRDLTPGTLIPGTPHTPQGAVRARTPKRKKVDPETDAKFNAFWATYPRAEDKGEALVRWRCRVKQGSNPDDMIAAARNYASAKSGEELRHVKHAATFLGPRNPQPGVAMPYEDWVKGVIPGERRGEIRAPTRSYEEVMRDRYGGLFPLPDQDDAIEGEVIHHDPQ